MQRGGKVGSDSTFHGRTRIVRAGCEKSNLTLDPPPAVRLASGERVMRRRAGCRPVSGLVDGKPGTVLPSRSPLGRTVAPINSPKSTYRCGGSAGMGAELRSATGPASRFTRRAGRAADTCGSDYSGRSSTEHPAVGDQEPARGAWRLRRTETAIIAAPS